MNGPHDLGGQDGLGPIRPESEHGEPVFHASWERRVFALTLAAGASGQWNLDQSRHARERQHPIAYLSHSYYENWLAGLETLLLENNMVTPDELASGITDSLPDPKRSPPLQATDVASALHRGKSVQMSIDRPARFHIGENVRVANNHPRGHTRAPRYTRGRTGLIKAYHGAHVFPDQHAKGERVGEPLYSVEFTSCELWGAGGNPLDAILVDLFEPYLEHM
jgi:nitrile hydratase